MGQEKPAQRREGALIEKAAKTSGLSAKTLATIAEISDTRWRHIIRGWQPGPGGTARAVKGPARTVARMAVAAGVTPQDLTDAGRGDAVALMNLGAGSEVRDTAALLARCAATLAQHTTILDRQTAILDRLTVTLDRHTVMLDEVNDKLDRIESGG